MFNLILNEDDFYGFVRDIKAMFVYNLQDDELDESTKEAIKEAIAYMSNLDSDCIYHCWYEQMGAFIFKKMVEKEGE